MLVRESFRVPNIKLGIIRRDLCGSGGINEKTMIWMLWIFNER